MAEQTGLRNNALPYPVYGVPYGVVFPLLDVDGDLVSGGGSDTPDSERSLNGDTFADCTNELTEIATASGMYYLLLTAVEMTADVVAVICKVATATTQTTPMVLYPRKLPQIRTGTAQAGAAGTITLDASASAIDDHYNGCLVYLNGGTGSGQARIVTDYAGSTKVASVTPNWATTPDATSTFILYLPEGRWVMEANVKAVSDDQTAADNLELDYDGTGYAKTNSTIGTCTTNTDMRGTNSAALASVCTEARLAELDAANLPTDVANVKTDTAAILVDTAVIGAAGAGLTAIPWNAAWDAEVQSECADALTAYSASTLTAAQVNTEVDTALADINLDHLVGTATAIPAIPAGTFLDQIVDDGTAAFDRTTDSLQAIRDTAPLGTAMRGTDNAALASVCTEARLAELDVANLPTDVANVKTDTAAILVDTGTDGVVVASGSKAGYALSATGADLITSAATFAAAIADAVLTRSVATVESTAAEWSLCTVVLAMLESSVSGTIWTIKRTDGSTTHKAKTVTTDAAALPITGVS